MSADEHRAQADGPPWGAAILTVSSTRTEADDRSGATIARWLASEEHPVAVYEIVDDDIDAIQRAVQRVVDADVPVVILTGGTGFTGRDVTPEAVEPLFTRTIPGFGELFRWLSYEQVGAAAMLSRAVAGIVGRSAVFALPGSTKACALAMQKLILPEAGHLVHLLRKAESGPPAVRGWLAAVAAAGAQLLRDVDEPLPPALAEIPDVRRLLAEAGETGAADVDQWRYSLWGFPDLRRPTSRVIAVSAGAPLAEVAALHRYPREAGTCVRGDGGWVASRDTPVAEVAAAVTGRPPPAGGALFAVGDGRVYIEREGLVHEWDGAVQRDRGTPVDALIHLLREWTTR